MNNFTMLQNEINELKIGADDDLMDVANKLHDQLHCASNSSSSREDLSEFLKSDNDVLDSGAIDEDTGLWETVRSIQDGIINEFGEEEKK